MKCFVYVCIHVCGFVHVCVSFTSMVGCVISRIHGDMRSNSGHSTTFPNPTRDMPKHLELIGRFVYLPVSKVVWGQIVVILHYTNDLHELVLTAHKP